MKFFTQMMVFLASMVIGHSCTSMKLKECETTADCAKDECCLENWVDSMLGGWVTFGNYCAKRAEKDAVCDMNVGDANMNKTYPFLCPCQDGLRCGFKDKNFFFEWPIPLCLKDKKEKSKQEDKKKDEEGKAEG